MTIWPALYLEMTLLMKSYTYSVSLSFVDETWLDMEAYRLLLVTVLLLSTTKHTFSHGGNHSEQSNNYRDIQKRLRSTPNIFFLLAPGRLDPSTGPW